MAVPNLPDYFPQRINMFIANMQYDAGVDVNGPLHIEFGAITAAGTLFTSAALTTGVANIVYPGGAVGTPYTLTDAQGRWGRVMTLEASAACTRTYAITGHDYLGQPIRQTGTLAGTTPQNVTKAFKHVNTIELGSSADTVTVTLKTATGMGLPYRTHKIEHALEDNALATAPTLTAPVQTTGTATSGDPRGTVVFNGTPNGTITFAAAIVVDPKALHGLAHFAG